MKTLAFAAAATALLLAAASPALAADARERSGYDTNPAPRQSTDRLIPPPPGSSVDSRRDSSERAIDGRPRRNGPEDRPSSGVPSLSPYTGTPSSPADRLGR